MAVRTHRELIPKTIINMHAHSPQADPTILDQMSKNITRQGITNSTLNYLRVSGDIQKKKCLHEKMMINLKISIEIFLLYFYHIFQDSLLIILLIVFFF